MITEECIHQSKEMCFIILWELSYTRNPPDNIFFEKLVGIAIQIIY